MAGKKVERFAIYAAIDWNGEQKKHFVADTAKYPTDDDLKQVWQIAKKRYNKVYYLNVEKQIRFE